MHSKRSSLPVLAAILIAATTSVFSAPASAAPASPPTPFSLTDALGRKVAFDRAPQRIAMTGKALFMVVDAAYLFPEAASRIAAIGNIVQGERGFIPAIDSSYGRKMILENQAGPEQIAAANPDAVILKSSLAGGLGKSIEALGVPVVYVDFETPQQFERDLATLGKLFQDEKRATELAAAFRKRENNVAAALSGIEEGKKPSVLILYYSDQGGAASFNVPPLGWMQTMLVKMGGGRPAWESAQVGQGWTKVTIEQIAAWDPDQVYIVSYQKKVSDAIGKLRSDPQWSALRAVKSGALFGFPGDYYSWDQPDPRWILGLEWIASKMHPDRFVGVDMRREIRDFYREFYAVDEAAYKKIIEPFLSGDLP
jgi:iron complex transport system substrate-binding protein